MEMWKQSYHNMFNEASYMKNHISEIWKSSQTYKIHICIFNIFTHIYIYIWNCMKIWYSFMYENMILKCCSFAKYYIFTNDFSIFTSIGKSGFDEGLQPFADNSVLVLHVCVLSEVLMFSCSVEGCCDVLTKRGEGAYMCICIYIYIYIYVLSLLWGDS